MKYPMTILATGVLLSVAVFTAPHAAAYELEEGVNTAGVISYPTALDQPINHAIHTTIELTDIVKPELHLYNFRYGYQLGNFQLLGDLVYLPGPVNEFNHLEIKAKMRVISLDEFRTYIAFGLLGRYVEDEKEAPWRIDDRPASLFTIMSIELFPLDSWGGFLINMYLDNRVFSSGIKVQLYPSIQYVLEGTRYHQVQGDENWHSMTGVEFSGEQNFYFQILYSDVGANWFVQIGTGF